jgi:PhnB protein
MPATATTPKAPKAPATAADILLTPSLVCRDAAGAIEFYKRAFGAEEMRVIRTPDGRVMHAALTVGGAMVFLGEECVEFGSRSPQALGGSPVSLCLHVTDCDAVFARAVAAGCTVRMPPADMFWGDRFGVLSDPYGHVWSVATNVRKLTDEEIQKGAAAAAAQMQPELERRRAAGH